VSNTLAYHDKATIIVIKFFIVQVLGIRMTESIQKITSDIWRTTTLSLTTLNIMTLSITTISIKVINCDIRHNYTKHNIRALLC
jgi:hypothetical protein